MACHNCDWSGAMSVTSKRTPSVNSGNVLAGAYNPEDKSITTAGFLVGKVGHKVQKTDVDGVTEDYSYYDGANLLYTIRIVYTDITKEVFLSAERVV